MLGYNTLRLESAPLHTESAKWAAHAPAQVEAAFKRGAHVIGFTEVTHGKVADELSALAKAHGYKFIHGGGDTALAIKSRLKVLDSDGWVPVAGLRGYSFVTFDFHGSTITVFAQHWGTNHPDHHATRVAQTKTLIDAMHKASKGKRLAFYMGDANPDGPLSHPSTFPRADLDAAGLPLIYDELNTWPAHIGVNVMGRNKSDHRVQAKQVLTFDALGSDHVPVQARYRIKRPRITRP